MISLARRQVVQKRNFDLCIKCENIEILRALKCIEKIGLKSGLGKSGKSIVFLANFYSIFFFKLLSPFN